MAPSSGTEESATGVGESSVLASLDESAVAESASGPASGPGIIALSGGPESTVEGDPELELEQPA